MKPQEAYWNKVAEDKEFPTPFQINLFKKFVSVEMKILDVGCGYGRTLNELNNQGFRNLTGIDYAQNMINRGLRKYPYLNLEKNNGENLSYPNDEFDAVILIGVLTSNIEDDKQEKLISEIDRLLKDQGILYLADFLINTDERNIRRYSKYKNKYGIYGVFELPEGAVLRHHTISHIFKLTKDFNELSFQETVYNTMNGHRSNGFYYIGKRSEKII
jgi:ubiquinone/menaquinone biosynthesis C-methylase UbiE